MARPSASPAYITTRRSLLAGASIACCINFAGAKALIVKNRMPWWPDAGSPPEQVNPGAWRFFTGEEGSAVEALVDRLIPPDPKTPGAKDAGVAVYIDAQLAGPYGNSRGLYMRPPFQEGTAQQGSQAALTPAARYRQSLAALDKYCKAKFAGKAFRNSPDNSMDELLHGLEKGSVQLEGVSGKAFFEMLWTNTKEGFFADPVYGGNRDMVGWKMIGFPGARYDFRDWVQRHNQPYPLPPVSIGGHRPSNPDAA